MQLEGFCVWLDDKTENFPDALFKMGPILQNMEIPPPKNFNETAPQARLSSDSIRIEHLNGLD